MEVIAQAQEATTVNLEDVRDVAIRLRAVCDYVSAKGFSAGSPGIHDVPRDIFDAIPGDEKALCYQATTDPASYKPFWVKTWLNVKFFCDEPPASEQSELATSQAQVAA